MGPMTGLTADERIEFATAIGTAIGKELAAGIEEVLKKNSDNDSVHGGIDFLVDRLADGLRPWGKHDS